MNIFILDENPKKCAAYHNNKHVVKMITESAQMMCTVLWEHGIPAHYKSTHKNHPCTKWLGQSKQNWEWLRDLAIWLNVEYKLRYNHPDKNHAAYNIILQLPTPPLPDIGLTKFAMAMPEDCKSDNVVESYRKYYKLHKQHINFWKTQIPDWYKE